MKKKWMLVFTMAAVLFCSAIPCFGFAAAVDTPLKQASGGPSGTAPAKSMQLFGTVDVRESTYITAGIPAKVVHVHVREGQHVTAGDPLVTLDYTDYTDDLKEKEMGLKAAKEARGNLALEISEKKGKLESQSEPDFKKLLKDLEYARKKHDIENLGFAIEALKSVREEEIRQLEALLKEKDGAIAIMEFDIGRLKDRFAKSGLKENGVLSSIQTGIADEITISQGAMIAGSEKLLCIIHADDIFIKVDAPEEFIKNIKISSKVIIVPQADATRQYKGSVTYISGKAITRNGETVVPIEISLENADPFLLPGFNVSTDIEVKE
jgi:multidrug resistance efflux pump